MRTESLIKEFTALPEKEQRSFLDAVLKHMYGEQVPQMTEGEWESELDRRVESYESGKVTAFSAEQVEKELSRKHDVQFIPSSRS